MLAVIPARGGSKSIPQKNIKYIGKHPLIAYSIAVARMSKIIDRVIVSTDSDKIAEISSKYGAEVPFLRPSEFAKDDSIDMEWIEHLLSYVEKKEHKNVEYLVHLRPTTPFREIKIVDEGIKYILKSPPATSLRSPSHANQPPQKMFKMSGSYLEGFFNDDERIEYYNLPRQSFPQAFNPNGYIDILRNSTIKTGQLHGNKILGFITEPTPDIDAEEDFKNALNLLNDFRFKPIIKYLEDNYK